MPQVPSSLRDAVSDAIFRYFVHRPDNPIQQKTLYDALVNNIDPTVSSWVSSLSDAAKKELFSNTEAARQKTLDWFNTAGQGELDALIGQMTKYGGNPDYAAVNYALKERFGTSLEDLYRAGNPRPYNPDMENLSSIEPEATRLFDAWESMVETPGGALEPVTNFWNKVARMNYRDEADNAYAITDKYASLPAISYTALPGSSKALNEAWNPIESAITGAALGGMAGNIPGAIMGGVGGLALDALMELGLPTAYDNYIAPYARAYGQSFQPQLEGVY